MDLTPADRALACRATQTAPTLLEPLFWGWLSQNCSHVLYFQELAITDLTGRGNQPDNFPGIP